MGDTKLARRPVKQIPQTYEALYQEMVRDWPGKAEALHTRRWRIVRHNVINL